LTSSRHHPRASGYLLGQGTVAGRLPTAEVRRKRPLQSSAAPGGRAWVCRGDLNGDGSANRETRGRFRPERSIGVGRASAARTAANRLNRHSCEAGNPRASSVYGSRLCLAAAGM